MKKEKKWSCLRDYKRIGTCIMYLPDSDTIKICWYWPDTNTDTRIGAALGMSTEVICDVIIFICLLIQDSLWFRNFGPKFIFHEIIRL